jgi:hypothetical protein
MLKSVNEPSWKETFALLLTALQVSQTQKQLVLRAFTDIAAEWMNLPSDGPMPFQSGVCPDGSPLELSIQFNQNGSVQVRFIAQPGNPDLPVESQVDWSIGRVVDFVKQWGGVGTEGMIQEALSIYPVHNDPWFSGNFRYWLGLSTDTAGAHMAKVYFNPWACKSEFSGAYAIYHLLKSAGADTGVLQSMTRWVNPEIGATPHIVGFNLRENHISSVKLYLQAVWNRATLNRLVHETAMDPMQLQTQTEIRMRPRGEVHLAIVCRPGCAPSVRFNLYCPDWFDSDLDAIAMLPESLASASAGTLEGIRQLCRKNSLPGRRINFIGLDRDTATIYLKVTGVSRINPDNS